MKIKIYSTQSGETEVNTGATNWADLKKELRQLGISYNNMKAVIGETKVTLEADGAELPKTPFTLFLMPRETKSGITLTKEKAKSMPYKEIRASISAIIKENPTSKDFFNAGGNYTRKSTEDLRVLLISYLMKGHSVAVSTSSSKASATTSSSSKRTKSKAKSMAKPQKESKGIDFSTMRYKDLRATIQGLVHGKYSPEAAEHFNKEKNYTLKSTDVMRDLLSKWKYGVGEDAMKEVIQATPEKVRKNKKEKVQKAQKVKQQIQKIDKKRSKLVDQYEALLKEVPGVRRSYR